EVAGGVGAGLPLAGARPVLPPPRLGRGGGVPPFPRGGDPPLLPAFPAVTGAEYLAQPRDAVDLIGIARVQRHRHHRALGLDAVIDAPPGLAEVVAAIE